MTSGPEYAEALSQSAPPPEGLPVAEVPAADEAAAQDVLSHPNVLTRINTLFALSYTSALATSSEYAGYTEKLPDAAKLVASSSAHPLLGYVGASAADALLHKAPKKVRIAASFIAATVTNFMTEAAQSVLVSSPEYANFLSSRNLPETAKDYGFSLLGMGLYMLQQRHSMRKQQANQ